MSHEKFLLLVLMRKSTPQMQGVTHNNVPHVEHKLLENKSKPCVTKAPPFATSVWSFVKVCQN